MNPYKDTQADAVEDGSKFILTYACSGCHGGGGGGGMCPPLTNDTWVYGGDDDTLFRLVTLGSDELQKQGYVRKGRENVVGPMPPFGAIVKTSDDLWRLLAFIRSKYSGDPAYKFGTPPDQAVGCCSADCAIASKRPRFMSKAVMGYGRVWVFRNVRDA